MKTTRDNQYSNYWVWRGGGEGAALPHISYIGMCHCEGYGLGSVDWDMVQKSEIFGVEQGINFHETNQLLEFRDTKSGIG